MSRTSWSHVRNSPLPAVTRLTTRELQSYSSFPRRAILQRLAVLHGWKLIGRHFGINVSRAKNRSNLLLCMRQLVLSVESCLWVFYSASIRNVPETFTLYKRKSACKLMVASEDRLEISNRKEGICKTGVTVGIGLLTQELFTWRPI